MEMAQVIDILDKLNTMINHLNFVKFSNAALEENYDPEVKEDYDEMHCLYAARLVVMDKLKQETEELYNLIDKERRKQFADT